MITATDAIEALRQVVLDAGPLWRHTGKCEYLRCGEPCCGVARALSRCGVSNQVLRAMDLSSTPWIKLVETPGLEITFEARAILWIFQKNQDENIIWETCLDKAEQAYQLFI